MPPVPVGPGSMNNMHNHQRRESTQSESGPSHLHSQRGGMSNSSRRGGHQSYGQGHHYPNQYNNGYGRGGYANPNQNRGPPPNMSQPAYVGPGQVPGYGPNSPRNMHRSPAMSHASPSLSAVQPMVTTQLYPPQQYMPSPQVSDLSFPFFKFTVHFCRHYRKYAPGYLDTI